MLADIKRGKRVHQVLDEGTVRRKRNKENGFVTDGKKPPMDFASRFGSTFELAIACQESMGAIVDRSQEMLGPNDVAIESARKVLMTAAVDLMEGTIPVIVNKSEAYRVRSYAGGLAPGVAFDEDDDVRRGVVARV